MSAAVLATGAWLKNRACRLDRDGVHWSALHGDLATPQACVALQASLEALLAAGPVDAIAHDLHPDFHGTRLAQALAARLDVPAIGVQHHHAHVAAALAAHAVDVPVIGLALDGVGLGSDGTAWGGELLWVHGATMRRLAHLAPLRLAGGDRAAREPWRMVASVLHALGRDAQIVPRLAPRVGEPAARTVAALLARGVNCPPTTSAGRWFDAAAGALALLDRQDDEAQAAIALEQAATRWLASAGEPPVATAQATPGTPPADGATPASRRPTGVPAPAGVPQVIDLRPLLASLLDAPAGADAGEAAARFHLGLADALVAATVAAAHSTGCRQVVLSGGCFFNRLLDREVERGLRAHGLAVLRPGGHGPGDAGLAVGQAWVAAAALRARDTRITEATTCA